MCLKIFFFEDSLILVQYDQYIISFIYNIYWNLRWCTSFEWNRKLLLFLLPSLKTYTLILLLPLTLHPSSLRGLEYFKENNIQAVSLWQAHHSVPRGKLEVLRSEDRNLPTILTSWIFTFYFFQTDSFWNTILKSWYVLLISFKIYVSMEENGNSFKKAELVINLFCGVLLILLLPDYGHQRMI